MGRFLNVVWFVMVAALGLVPAAALAQQPRIVRENGRDVLVVTVRGRMDLGSVVRLGNQYAAPGTTITADHVVEANPGKINYACYRGPGDHHGSRNPANWQTCSVSQQRRWVVTGLEYRVPLQPMLPRSEESRRSSVHVVGTRPSANASASTAVAAGTDADRDALALPLWRNEGATGDMPDGYRANLHDHREFAERLDKIETELRYLWVALIVACLLAIGLLFKSLWPARQEVPEARPRKSARSFVQAFVGASVPGPSALSGDTKLELEAPVLRQASPRIVPSPREFSSGVRSSVPPPLPKASPAEPPPVSQDNLAQVHGLVLNLAAEQRSTQALAVGKARLPRLFRAVDKLYWKFHDTIHAIRTLEELPPEAPGRQKHPERFASQLAKLRLRERIIAPRFTRAQQAFDSLHFAHTGLRLPRLWEAPDHQLLQQRADLKLLHLELYRAQAKVVDLEQKLLSANRATDVAKEEAESQCKLRAEDIEQLNTQLEELRAQQKRERDESADAIKKQEQEINQLREQLAESQRLGQDKDRQIVDLSGQFMRHDSRMAELGAQLTTVTRENNRLKAQNARFKARLGTAPGNGSANSQDAAKAPTRKITQPFAAVQPTPPAASGSRLPPKPSGKTDPPTSG